MARRGHSSISLSALCLRSAAGKFSQSFSLLGFMSVELVIMHHLVLLLFQRRRVRLVLLIVPLAPGRRVNCSTGLRLDKISATESSYHLKLGMIAALLRAEISCATREPRFTSEFSGRIASQDPSEVGHLPDESQ